MGSKPLSQRHHQDGPAIHVLSQGRVTELYLVKYNMTHSRHPSQSRKYPRTSLTAWEGMLALSASEKNNFHILLAIILISPQAQFDKIKICSVLRQNKFNDLGVRTTKQGQTSSILLAKCQHHPIPNRGLAPGAALQDQLGHVNFSSDHRGIVAFPSAHVLLYDYRVDGLVLFLVSMIIVQLPAMAQSISISIIGAGT